MSLMPLDLYMEKVWPTHYENWPDELRAVSFPTRIVKLTAVQAGYLKLLYEAEMADEATVSELKSMRTAPDYDAMKKVFLEAMESFAPKGCYVKLNRGMKDSYFGYKNGFRVDSPRKLFSLIYDSERFWWEIQTHQCLHEKFGHDIIMLFREWHDIPPHEEWRCFRRDGRLVAISQYDYRHKYEDIQNRIFHKHLRYTISKFYNIIKNCLPQNIVFDLWVSDVQKITWKFTLIEINPFFKHTDPCLFEWDKPPLSGKIEDFIELRVQENEPNEDDWGSGDSGY